MTIIVKVQALERQVGKDYDSIINQFEFVTVGGSQDFVDMVAKLITIMPKSKSEEESKQVEVLDPDIDPKIPGSCV